MRKRGLLVGIILLSVFMTSLVSAATAFERGVDSFVGYAEPVVEFLVGPIFDVTGVELVSLSEILFIKLLVLILLLFIIHVAVTKVPGIGDKPGVSWVVSVIISLIAVRYLTSEGLVNFIWLPYGTLGVTLAVGLPFLIAFFFLESFESRAVRKVGWILMFVIFIALTIFRWDTLEVSEQTGLVETPFFLGWIYIIAVILCALAFLFDSNVHSWFAMGALGRIADEAKRQEVGDLSRRNVDILAALKKEKDPDERKRLQDEFRDNKRKVREILRA